MFVQLLYPTINLKDHVFKPVCLFGQQDPVKLQFGVLYSIFSGCNLLAQASKYIVMVFTGQLIILFHGNYSP